MKRLFFVLIVFLGALSAVFSQTQGADIKTLAKSAASGNPEAQVTLGIKYFNGEGVSKNIPEAIRLFTQAAEQKNLDAQLNLGWIYGHTEGYLDPKKTAKFYGMAAEQGDADAQYYLGLMYLKGEGVKKDYSQSVLWLKKSALQGKTEAQAAYGDLFETGKGVKADKIEALKWYLIALKNGDGAADLYIDSIKKGMTAAQIAEAEKRAANY